MNLEPEIKDRLNGLIKEYFELSKNLDNDWQERRNRQADISEEIRQIATQYPIANGFMSLPGIQPAAAVKLLLLIHIEKAGSVSNLWSYCGVSPIRKFGERHHPKAREMCFILAETLSGEGAAYSAIYEKILEEKGDSETAKLVVVRAFLSHLYEYWKEQLGELTPENLPQNRPYPNREQYGWPPINREIKYPPPAPHSPKGTNNSGYTP